MVNRKTGRRPEAINRRVLLYKRLPAWTAVLTGGPALGCLIILLTASDSFSQSKTIVDEWSEVQAPKPPELKPATMDPKTTALLVLDFVKQTCNAERRPRCLASVPKVEALLNLARSKGVNVIHSITSAATPADIAKELAPRDGEPIVKTSADKFFKTDLEKILTEKGIKAVVVVGTAAQGAVLNTASQARSGDYK
jgi:isochorismatase family protein